MQQLSGVIPAMPTPLLENENIDVAGVHKVVDYVIQQGASGIFVLGSMGEGPALVDEQKQILVETAAAHIAGRVPLLAGISDVSTRKAMEAGKVYQQSGADYLVTTAPFYYKFPHPDSIVGYVSTLAEQLQRPVVFYQVPSASGNEVSFETLDTIFNLPNVGAVKYSSSDIHHLLELLRKYPDRDTRPGALLQGDEFALDTAMLLGADGLVTGGGTLFIDTLVKLCNACWQNDQIGAFQLQQEFRNQMDTMLGPNLAVDWMFAIKNKLKELGLCEDHVTRPFLKRD